MNKIESHGRDNTSERDLFSVDINSLADYPLEVNLPGQFFILLNAGNAANWSDQKIADFDQKTLNQGAVHFCAWGADCERVHDTLDETIIMHWVDSGLTFEKTIITTWHSDEDLGDALWFALQVAVPSAAYDPECNSVLVVSADSEENYSSIVSWLQDPARFNQ